MSKSNTSLTFVYKIKGDGSSFAELTKDFDKMRDALQRGLEPAEKLKTSLINYNQVVQSFDALGQAAQKLDGMVQDLSKAYATQVEAEVKLETVMRQRMAATDAQIQGIKDLCSEQQKLGVIGDEVQLAGAQQLSTFLANEQALRLLIPAMNNLGAKQKGLAVTSGDLVNIGNMMGKVMQGQTSALRRVGISFTEAEEQALKYGSEVDRAAALAKIITNNVGEMNAALADTDAGRLKQMENALGDVKEQIGGVVKSAAPYTALISQIVAVTANAGKATAAFKGLYLTVAGSHGAFGRINAQLIATKLHLDTVGKMARFAAAGLRLVASVTVIGAALWAVTEAINYFTKSSEEATDAVNDLSTAQGVAARATEMTQERLDAETNARKDAIASLELSISKIKNFAGSKTEEKKLIGELNSEYGKTMGYFSSLSSWYNALIKNSKAYCDQMVAEAKARKLADQIAELEINRDKIKWDETGKPIKYSKENKVHTYQSMSGRVYNEVKGNAKGAKDLGEVEGTSEWDEAVGAIRKANLEIAHLKNQINSSAQKITMPVMGDNEAPDLSGGESGNPSGLPKTDKQAAPEGSIAALKDRISAIEKQINNATTDNERYKLAEQAEDLRGQIKELQIPIKLVEGREAWKEMEERLDANPISIPVEIDVSGMPEQLEGLPTMAETLQQKLDKVANVAQQASQAFRGMGQSLEMPALDVMGIIAGAIATMIQGYAFATSEAGLKLGPFGWLGFGLTGLASLTGMISQVKSISKFADGGIVSGPTMALVGEYAGAGSNPEVIAPLDKLQSLIGEGGGGTMVVIPDVRIKGGDLVLAFRNQQRVSGKSGRNFLK